MIVRDENRILQLGLDTIWQQRLFLVSLMGLRQLEEFDHKTDITVPVTTVTELSGTGAQRLPPGQRVCRGSCWDGHQNTPCRRPGGDDIGAGT